MELYYISIRLDTRRKKANKKYPVKLRVFTPNPRKQKLYSTIFEYSESEFKSIWETEKPRKEYKVKREQLKALEEEAYEVADKITPFDFVEFEKKMFRKQGEELTLLYNYKNRINELKTNNQLSTKETYELAQKSIVSFLESQGKNKYKKLTFFDITPEWLKKYEEYMTETKDRSITTVSIYIRTLRAIFNKAIDEGELDKEFYPFGKKKYKVPKTKNTKRSLSKQELKTLFQSIPKIPEQQKAKDFWFFSYSCNGMNLKDIALLKYKDIEDDKIEFYRVKTRSTSKGDLKPITVYLNDFTRSIIEMYGKKKADRSEYIFDIFNKDMSPEDKQRAIKNFTRFVNQHMKNLCKDNKLPENISTYWARHSFASNFVASGGSIVDIMESMGHNNIQTTQNYLQSFEGDAKKKILNSLMDFK